MKRIEDIVQGSSEQIKEILLEEARKIEEFSQTLIGFMSPRQVCNDERHLFKNKSPYSCGIALPKSGIFIKSEFESCTESYIVIMMPNGLYRFSTAPFFETKDKTLTGLITRFPNWGSKQERPTDYLVHGEQALYKMQKLLVEAA